MANQEYNQRKWLVLLTLLVLLIASFFLSVGSGVYMLTPRQVFSAAFLEKEGLNHTIVWNVRVPRVFVGGLTGISLSTAGVILQGIMRNPLASPGTIGINSGAGFAATVCLVLFPHMEPLLTPTAFLGAFGTTMLVYLLSWKNGIRPLRMVLAGMAVSSFVSAAINGIVLFFPDRMQNTLGFSIGSLAAKNWSDFYHLLPYTVLGFLGAMFLARQLNILGLGDEMAAGLGLSVERVRFALIVLSSLLSASAVAVVGLLGFVGLIVPHIMRMIIGSDHRFLLPAAAMAGAILVMLCDTFSRLVIAPAEMPVGIVIALIGAPFFLYLLRERMQNHG